MQAVGCKQGHAVGAALARRLHAGDGCARRRCQIPLGNARRLEQPAVAQQGIHGHILVLQNLQPHGQRGKGRVDVGPHEVGQRKIGIGAAQQQRQTRIKMGHALAGKVVHRGHAAAVGCAPERRIEQLCEKRSLIDLSPAERRTLGQQADPCVQIARAVVAVDHGHSLAAGGRDHVNLGVDA